ncbi:protein containing Lipoprotein LpqB, GerMN domain protein [gut metagenome]|uniref:Protein containing Lipoprotein LpqB, GerMN domain protein n=1 Tax=gut metagenome TaxID=749906 RepID=J9G5F0_9ZZZZ
MPKDVEIKPVIPKRVKVLGFEIENGRITVDFGGEYYEMNAVREVLCRAAVVQSLVQIDEIESVAFEVEGNPLTDADGKVVGNMRAEDFIKSTGSALHSYEKTDLTLYFGNEEGTALVKEAWKEVRHNTNMPIEKLVVERLMEGPDSGQHQPVLAPEVRLIGTSVKDGICYVNFDENFLRQESEIDPALQVEAVVRSIIENGKGIRLVQILINGKDGQNYKGISLEQPFGIEPVRKEGEKQ